MVSSQIFRNGLEQCFSVRIYVMIISLCSVLSTGVYGEGNDQFDHSHKIWSEFLHRYVTVHGHESYVAYKKVKQEKSVLEAYLKSLESVTKLTFDHFSQDEKLAFLINAYNAFTVKLIVDHYPVTSIKTIRSYLKGPWKIKFFTLLGGEQNLDGIEHDMIRRSFNEPRIHFALVCASKGCPALRNEAFTAGQLDYQLEESARNFLGNSAKNRYLPKERKLEISSIFNWYGDDFVKKFGSLESFLGPRITDDPTGQKLIREKMVAISYLDYDWTLNEAN